MRGQRGDELFLKAEPMLFNRFDRFVSKEETNGERFARRSLGTRGIGHSEADLGEPATLAPFPRLPFFDDGEELDRQQRIKFAGGHAEVNSAPRGELFDVPVILRQV